MAHILQWACIQLGQQVIAKRMTEAESRSTTHDNTRLLKSFLDNCRDTSCAHAAAAPHVPGAPGTCEGSTQGLLAKHDWAQHTKCPHQDAVDGLLFQSYWDGPLMPNQLRLVDSFLITQHLTPCTRFIYWFSDAMVLQHDEVCY